MALLIDSSIFIALERRKQTISALGLMAGPDEPVAMAAITASELLAGSYLADSPHRRTRRQAFVETLLEAVPVLPFDTRVARIHAPIWAQLMAKGQPIGAHDLLVAATAMAYGYSIMTENVRDFGKVSGLEVRRPNWG